MVRLSVKVGVKFSSHSLAVFSMTRAATCLHGGWEAEVLLTSTTVIL